MITNINKHMGTALLLPAIAVLMLVGVSLVPYSKAAGSETAVSDSLSLRIRTDRTNYVVGDRITLSLVFKNSDAQTIRELEGDPLAL